MPVYQISYKRSGTLFSNIYINKYLKTIRRIICVQQIYRNRLCVSKSRPFIGLMIIVKKFREYILLTRSPSKYFSTFQKLFEDVYICYCCRFYSMCLRCFLLPWKIFSSVQNGRFGENLQNWIMHFSLYYCFIYTNMNNLIYMIFRFI